MSEAEVIGEVVAEETRNLPAVRVHEALVTRAEISVDDVVAQRDKIRAVMERVMVDSVHYGLIPGVSKPTLFKPGAEVLTTTFRLAPSYLSERIFHEDGHLTVVAKCVLTHAPSGMVLGEGEGLCTSREAKYAYRNAKRVCPACGAEAIIKGKAEYGGGWLCWKKQDGCGAKYPDGDEAIVAQEAGKTGNPELPDTWNTVLKMADKRALVAAVLNCTAASDIFAQDVEDSGASSEPRSDAGRSNGGAEAGVASREGQDARPAGARKAGGAPDKLAKMRADLLALVQLADDKRRDGTGTLAEVTAALAGVGANSVEEADEHALAVVGADLGQWFAQGCKGEFKPVPF